MVDQSLPAAVASLQYFEIAHLFRLPNEDILQPTTQVGTRSAVHTTHHVIFRVEYTRVGGGGLDRKPMAITSSHPITISSCLCMLESVLLPSYSEVDPFPVIRTEDRYSRRNRDTCVCGSPLETLVAQEGGLLIEAVQSDEVLAKVTHE